MVSRGTRSAPYLAKRSQGGGRSRLRASATRSGVIRVGGESVSGYMRSGPGKIRSKVV